MEKRHIESTTAQIENEDVPLLICLSGTKTVSNGSGSGLVNYTEDIHARNGTSILGCLTLVVIEIGGDSYNGLLNGLAKLGLGNFFHLHISKTHIRYCDTDPKLGKDMCIPWSRPWRRSPGGRTVLSHRDTQPEYTGFRHGQ